MQYKGKQMKNNKMFLLIFTLVLLAGCASPLTNTQRGTIKTIAVINQFPRHPNYAIIGTTVFNNKYDEVKDGDYFKYVSNITVEYLAKNGYTTTIVNGEQKGLDKKYDLVLTLIPRDIYEMPGTNGYGVNQRSFLGVSSKPKVYVALNISPKLHGSVTGNAYYNFALEPLSFEELPTKWGNLSASQKREVDIKLKRNIKKAITELMGKLGI
jgi:hypothetical protein